MCLYTKYILNPRYKPNKKNGGTIPPVYDHRLLYVPIGCQKCIECRKRKAREWQVRLTEDIKTNKNGKFITLTFSDESIKELSDNFPTLSGYELDNAIATLATRRFLERWRKTFKKSLRHWFVTELGHQGTNNIHIHGIIWSDSLTELDKHWKYGFTWKGKQMLEKIGQHVYAHTINYVNDSTIGYITKYVNKIDLEHQYYQPIILTSPGIGGNYTKTGDYKRNEYQHTNTKEHYRTRTGHRIALPIYYRNKLYTDEQKEQLWLNTLNKQKRYVLGKPVDISKGLTEYFAATKYARKSNIELGYGTPKIDEERRQTERQQRELQQLTRIYAAESKDITPRCKARCKRLGVVKHRDRNPFGSRGHSYTPPAESTGITGTFNDELRRPLTTAFQRHKRQTENIIWTDYNKQLNSTYKNKKL